MPPRSPPESPRPRLTVLSPMSRRLGRPRRRCCVVLGRRLLDGAGHLVTDFTLSARVAHSLARRTRDWGRRARVLSRAAGHSWYAGPPDAVRPRGTGRGVRCGVVPQACHAHVPAGAGVPTLGAFAVLVVFQQPELWAAPAHLGKSLVLWFFGKLDLALFEARSPWPSSASSRSRRGDHRHRTGRAAHEIRRQRVGAARAPRPICSPPLSHPIRHCTTVPSSCAVIPPSGRDAFAPVAGQRR